MFCSNTHINTHHVWDKLVLTAVSQQMYWACTHSGTHNRCTELVLTLVLKFDVIYLFDTNTRGIYTTVCLVSTWNLHQVYFIHMNTATQNRCNMFVLKLVLMINVLSFFSHTVFKTSCVYYMLYLRKHDYTGITNIH